MSKNPRLRKTSASNWHGLAWLAWAAAGAITIQLASSPLYVGLVIAASVIVVVTSDAEPPKTKVFGLIMTWAVAFAALRVVLTVLTVHANGHTILTTPSLQVPRILGGFEVGGPIDAETLFSAGSQALSIVAIIAVFATFNAVASQRDLVEALPRSFYEVGVAIAVALAFIPSIAETVSETREADRARAGGRPVKKRRLRRVLVPVLETCLERAVLLSESMDARGFGAKRAAKYEVMAGWLGVASLGFMGSALVALVARSQSIAVALGVLSLAALGAAFYISATHAPSRYKRRPITRSDVWMVLASFGAPATTWLAALVGDKSLAWPSESLRWPVVSPLPLVGVFALLAPVLLQRGAFLPQALANEGDKLDSYCTQGSSEIIDKTSTRPQSVRFDNVHFEFPDGTKALLDICLEIEKGQCLVVMGNSGSGKSTLLRTVNGIVPHSTGGRLSGSVWVGPYMTSATKPRYMAELVGFVHQDPEAHFVVDEVESDIAFAARNIGLPPREIAYRVTEIAERLGIDSLLHRNPATLSGGEKQRCAIAAALVCRPAVLVLDEPTAQLDPEGADAVFDVLENIRSHFGTTVILAEHRLERASRLANQAVHMEKGRIERRGLPKEVIPFYEGAPEVTSLGVLLGWDPPPITIEEAVRLASRSLRPRFMQSSNSKQRPPQAFSTRSGPLLAQSASELAAKLSSPGEVYLKARGVSVAFGTIQALRDVDFEVAEGEIVAVLGKNGSGKTTLLRVLAGLITPGTGHVERLCRAAYVPQDPGTLLHAETVSEEVLATLDLLGKKGTAQKRTAEVWMEVMGLAELACRHPRSLSGGERQRLAIAAVAVGGAEVLLLDEPTRGIDASSRKVLMDFIPSHARRGGAVVIATHDTDLAASVATRVLILNDGYIVADGPPRRVLIGTPFEPQISKVLPPFLSVSEIERELAAVR